MSFDRAQDDHDSATDRHEAYREMEAIEYLDEFLDCAAHRYLLAAAGHVTPWPINEEDEAWATMTTAQLANYIRMGMEYKYEGWEGDEAVDDLFDAVGWEKHGE